MNPATEVEVQLALCALPADPADEARGNRPGVCGTCRACGATAEHPVRQVGGEPASVKRAEAKRAVLLALTAACPRRAVSGLPPAHVERHAPPGVELFVRHTDGRAYPARLQRRGGGWAELVWLGGTVGHGAAVELAPADWDAVAAADRLSAQLQAAGWKGVTVTKPVGA